MGSFFGAYLNPGFQIWLLLAFLTLFLLILNQRLLWRIICFFAFLVFICAGAARFSKEAYDQKAQTLPTTMTSIQGIVKEISPRANSSQKLLIATETYNIALALYDGAAALAIEPGQTIRFKATIMPMAKPLSPVHFDAYRYGLAHSIHARASISNPHDLVVAKDSAQGSFASIRQALREKILNAVSPHHSSLLLALVLGETGLFAPEQKEIYQSIGAQHLLAVSGLQVTLIAACVLFLLLPLFALCLPPPYTHLSHIVAALITILLLWLFVGLCQWPKSAVRAAMMTTIMLMPLLVRRRPDLFDAFFASGFLCLLIDPLSPLDLGFLLSYAAVFGLLWGHHASAQRFEKLYARSKLLGLFFALSITSISAFLATLPITAYYFQTLAPYSALANLILVPIASILQIPAILLTLIGALMSSQALISAGAFCAVLIELIAELLASIFGQEYFWPKLSSYGLIVSSIGLFLLFMSLLSKKISSIIVSLVLVSITPFELMLKNNRALVVTVMPVGQGDASLFSLPSGQHLLVDAGGQMYGHFDPGLSIVLPTLRRLGVNNLDVLIITHPDPDHILGAFAVLENMKVKEIWHSGFKPDHPLTERLLAVAREKNIVIKNTFDLAHDHEFGSTIIQILAPRPSNNIPYQPQFSSNNNSLVLRIVHGETALLWPGDVEEAGEQMLLHNTKNLSARVLKAPHHGSKTSSTKDFIDQVNPHYVIYSRGVKNKFNFPHDIVTERYHSRDIKSFDTAIDGEITLRIANNHIEFETYVPRS